MKKLFLFSILLILFGNSFSQIETVETLEDHQAIFSEIDISKITTGILYDRIIPLSEIEKYTGENTDAICTKNKWKQMYFELQNASYVKDTVNMPELDFIFGRKNRFTNGKLIPIYLLNYKYNKIKENALENELIILQNNKIIENPAKSETPYETKRVFAATPYKARTYYGNDFAFIFNDNFLYTNTDEIITDIYVDFDDGFGEIKAAKDKTLFVSYAETGKKTITVKAITQNNDTLNSKFAFNVKAKDVPEYTITRFETDEIVGIRYFCPYFGVYVPIPFACPDDVVIENVCRKGGSLYHFKSPHTPSVIENSILIVEGFDLNDDHFAEKLYEIFNKQQLADCILDNNYDIFIANFDVPSDYIANNAIFIENVINHINNIKSNKNELIIAGGSMGGLVSRYAITKMEQNNEDTETRLWISFDAPQEGANIPLGIQYWFEDLADFISFINSEYESPFDVPAAKQMLIYHHSHYPSASPERSAFVADLNNKGWPQTCRNIGITNGASDGTGQGYSPGSKILAYNINALVWQRYFTAWAVPDGGNNYVIFQRKKRNEIIHEKKVTNTDPIDTAPGGFSPTMKAIGEGDDAFWDWVHEHTPFNIDMLVNYQNNHAFIPAISALALDVDDYYYKFGTVPEQILLNKTPFDKLYFPTTNISNEPHVWVSNKTAINILDEFIPDYLVLDGHDWTQGEISAEVSIRMTNGFHASANDQVHLFLDEIDKSLLINEGWSKSNNKNIVQENNYKQNNLVNINEDDFIIYPNPTNGVFTISCENSPFKKEIREILITDITGKIVYSKNHIDNNEITINISSEKSGIYFLKFISNNKIINSKIIKL
ncbi:MAG: T9SS type A sorting domain-containing protein [Bacteroidales bacterium]|nr:T9SS type A sorting domain-containing protein [Bacteroidales bacterium]